METVHLIILAAGKGKRMKSESPKVLLSLLGKPLLFYLLDAIEQSSLAKPAVLVVGVGAHMVKSAAGKKFDYVLQEKQLGTGHAVQCAEELLQHKAKHIMVLYGDHPLVDQKTIDRIAQAHLKGSNPITMAATDVGDFGSWRSGFYDYGRIIRNDNNEIKKIVERKDASEEELEITEVNPSYFCFEAKWLWKHLKQLKDDNSQKEFYLTELPEIACREGLGITTVSIDPITALGVNTPQQLFTLEKILEKKS